METLGINNKEQSKKTNRLFDFLSPITYHLSPTSGFTLIELLIAITIFAIVVSIAVGGFVRALRTERQVVALMAANSNVSLAIEQMAREIRTARNFTIAGSGSDCGAGRGSELTFTNASRAEVTYRFNEGGWIERDILGRTERVTGGNVLIRYACFGLLGGQPYPIDDYPPRATISIGVSPVAQGISSNVTNVQTTVSARQIDS